MLTRPCPERHLGAFLRGLILCALSASTSLAQSRTPDLTTQIQLLPQQGTVFLLEEPGTEPKPVPSPDELRKKYPYESIVPRLTYESQRATRGKARAKPKLGVTARQQLNQADSINPEEILVRVKSLEMLHSDKVEEFVKKQGFGVGRMVTFEPSPRFLPYPPSPPLVFKDRPPQSSEAESHEVVSLPPQGIREEAGGAWSPSLEMLSDFHAMDRSYFASPASFGHIKDRRHVAGFQSHGFIGLPSLYHPQYEVAEDREIHPERWQIGRLELVSLLKHEKPAVYVSEHLPRMEELKDAKTRPLDRFEKESLDKLIDGEEIVTEARANDIRLLGALRASKQCLKCHEATHGELLGAFSYELFRDPPVKVKARRGDRPT